MWLLSRLPTFNREVATLRENARNFRASFHGEIYRTVSGRESVTVSPFLQLYEMYIYVYIHIIHVTHNPWFMLHPRVHRYLLRLHDNLIVRLRFQSDVIFAKFDLLLAPYASAFRIKRINYYHSFEQSSNTYAT